jgi:hypothetical protein
MEFVPRLGDRPQAQEVQPTPPPSSLTSPAISPNPEQGATSRASLNYLLLQKKFRRSLSRPLLRIENDPDPVQQTPLATECGPAPIPNLISVVRSRYAASAMKMLAHRLCRETTVVAAQIAMGTVEEVYRTVFPDPRSRLTFLIGVMTHGVWETPGDASNPS